MLQLKETVEEMPYQVTILIKQGDPATEILKIVTEQQADLIVLSTHRHSNLARIFNGTLLTKLLPRFNIPAVILYSRLS